MSMHPTGNEEGETLETGAGEEAAPETESPDAPGAPEANAESETPEPTPEERIAALEAEKSELNDKLLRTLAEVDNVRKRAEREKADARSYAIERFAGDLLSVADNLARALTALSEDDRNSLSEPGQNLLGGIEMTEKELHTVLARHAVVPIEAAPGTVFDPNLHQAVTQMPSEQPAGTVAQALQSGWRIHDRVLRAAMVAVSTGPAN